MKCLIIAAGRGSRLSKRCDSKPLIPLLGLSLIERVILTAKKAGLTDFYVVTGYNGEKVRRFLDRFCQNRDINVTHIINEEWEKANGLSILKAKGLLNENFILLMGDHIFDESILVRLKEKEIADNEVMLAVDKTIKTNTLVNADDVSKVLVEDSKVLDIGKNITKFNAYDTGIFLCSPAIFSAVEESLHDKDSSLSGGMRVMAEKGKAKTYDIKGDFWIDVDDERAFKKAEKRLLGSLKKTSDGPISRYLNRSISIRITKRLLKTGVGPNHVSFFSFVISMVGAFFFFLGGYLNLVIGAILAQVASIIDGCDGEIARLKFQVTEFGGWFDAVLDRYADAFLLFGLTWHAYANRTDSLILLIGFLAIIGSFMLSYTADKYDSLMRDRISYDKGFRMGRDVRVFLIFLGAIVNQVYLMLVVIAVVMNIETIRRIVSCRDHN